MTPSTTDSSERRAKARFEIQRELRYKVRGKAKALQAGTGDTVNISSAGIAIRIDQPLAAGSSVELSVSWPALLNDVRPMRLNIVGRILRAEGRNAVCTVDRYEFRTQGAPELMTFVGKAAALPAWIFGGSAGSSMARA